MGICGAFPLLLNRLRHIHYLLFVSASCGLFITGFGSPRLVDRDIAPLYRLSVEQLRAMSAAHQPPEMTAQAYLLYDMETEQLLFESNADTPLPPASLTKLMTALLVLEQDDLQAQVEVLPPDLIDGATMGLQNGETLTVEDLLWGLLVPSGNDAAMTLARYTAGSTAAFVERMNQRAQALGLTATTYANPHGFDEAGHLTSARDLLTLTRQLLTYALFRQIVDTAEIQVAGHTLQNTNQLLGAFPGANGVKTGTTIAAGECLVASITRDGHTQILVILGSRDRYADARTLYDAYTRNYKWIGSDDAGSHMLNKVRDADNRTWYLRVDGAPPELMRNDWRSPDLQTYRRIEPPPAGLPWQQGMRIGVLEWRLGNVVIGNQLLVLR
ncbi:MAG: D-alanyl-D-alanine carboxypeptidase family protein [Caldilineaceae bacterium]